MSCSVETIYIVIDQADTPTRRLLTLQHVMRKLVTWPGPWLSPNLVSHGFALHLDLVLTLVISLQHIPSHRRTMQSHKNVVTNTNANHNRRRKPRRQPQKEPAAVNPPIVNVQAEGWGSTADPWSGTIGT